MNTSGSKDEALLKIPSIFAPDKENVWKNTESLPDQRTSN
jgi:hypothetical protein